MLYAQERKSNIILAISVLFIISILFADTYLIPSTKTKEFIVTKYIIAQQGGRGSGGPYNCNMLQTASNKSYQVSYKAYTALNIGDNFIGTTSRLFVRTLALSYSYDNNIYSENVGEINNRPLVFWPLLIEAAISLIILLVSLLTDPNNIKNHYYTLPLWLASFYTAFNVITYFIG